MKVSIPKLYRNLNERIQDTGKMESQIDGNITLKMLRFSLVAECTKIILLTSILIVLILNG